MKQFVEGLGGVLMLLAWLVGSVLAKGFWSTFFSVVFPPYGWYLVVEWAMRLGGLV